MWIFGYGSLIWKPDIPFEESCAASIAGYERRFWQGSPDHRGTPTSPGRVVTLVEAGSQVLCHGRAFRIGAADVEGVLARLDHRERGGYERRQVAIQLSEAAVTGEDTVTGLVYFAAAGNGHFLGPAPIELIAGQIKAASGPSGPNLEYFVRLRQALRDQGTPDPHLESIAAHLADLEASRGAAISPLLTD